MNKTEKPYYGEQSARLLEVLRANFQGLARSFVYRKGACIDLYFCGCIDES